MILVNEFGLGDIVALKSHPFFKDLTSVVLSGEPQLLPPLMVIVEYLVDTKDQFDEKTGDVITRKGNSQCRCIWFSNKTYQFEDAWLLSSQLKIIKKNVRLLEKNDMFSDVQGGYSNCYVNVSFKTMPIELGKHKSAVSREERFGYTSDDVKTTINPLLSFVSPIMEVLQIVELKDLEKKEAKFDSRTGNQRRFTSKWAVKCKWFNPMSDKMSEKFLPIDVLNVIREPKPELLNDLQGKIDEEKYCKAKPGIGANETIIKPLSIVFRGGDYFLKAYDFRLNKNIELDVLDTDFEEINNLFIIKVPSFDFLNGGGKGKTVTKELIECIKQGKEKKALLRVKYINRNDKLIYRTINNYSFLETSVDDESIAYLKGECVSDGKERTFRLDRIQYLQMMDLTY